MNIRHSRNSGASAKGISFFSGLRALLPALGSFLLAFVFLAACVRATPTPAPPQPDTPTPDPATLNLDSDTQALIARADRVAFIIPFSHWDTDWHEAFPAYVKRSDGNILAAIQMVKANPRFRYTLEQTLFVQHFWDTYSEDRVDLKAAIERRQIAFAWGGVTQPETSLTAPAIQVRNLQLGQDWISQTFGPQYVPHTAWQSDAFGNSAAFPLFLAQSHIPYLFIGRWQHKCDPDYENCQPLPHTFYWKSPASDSRILVTYLSYPSAWDAIHNLKTEDEQVAALRQYVAQQFTRTDSKYVFIPMGSDFIDPLPNLQSLVDQWNQADPHTALVISDPETAFNYIATQPLPEYTVDLNPIWQAFYGSRPFAKIADKESEYYLTAADKFGVLIDAAPSSAWLTATVSAHYDNIGAVSFDSVWESSQRPRFEQTLTTAAHDLAATLARVASGVDAPLVIFNPTSWPRTEVVELQGALPDLSELHPQMLGPDHAAVLAPNAPVPSIGYVSLSVRDPPGTVRTGGPIIPVTEVKTAADGRISLSNAMVSVTLDPAHGGTFTDLHYDVKPNLINGFGDDVTYWDDTGDIYGAFFGNVRARESEVPAQVIVLAEGPLIARAQAVLILGGQPLTKTVTLRAGSPFVEVTLDLKALPETSAVLQTSTGLDAQTRTDDLGFAAFTHTVDNSPIVPGDITYRREIFYPITYGTDVFDGSNGLALITHGLQGVGGMGQLNILLARQVTRDQEGVTDSDYHTLRYAYLPHAEPMSAESLLDSAYVFNQPLIPVWRSGDHINVQLPFDAVHQVPLVPSVPRVPSSFSLLSTGNALISDLIQSHGLTYALVLDYDPTTPATLQVGDQQIPIARPDGLPPYITLVPIEVAPLTQPH